MEDEQEFKRFRQQPVADDGEELQEGARRRRDTSLRQRRGPVSGTGRRANQFAYLVKMGNVAAPGLARCHDRWRRKRSGWTAEVGTVEKGGSSPTSWRSPAIPLADITEIVPCRLRHERRVASFENDVRGQ